MHLCMFPWFKILYVDKVKMFSFISFLMGRKIFSAIWGYCVVVFGFILLVWEQNFSKMMSVRLFFLDKKCLVFYIYVATASELPILKIIQGKYLTHNIRNVSLYIFHILNASYYIMIVNLIMWRLLLIASLMKALMIYQLNLFPLVFNNWYVLIMINHFLQIQLRSNLRISNFVYPFASK